MSKHRFNPHSLDENDEGYDAVNFSEGLRVQDQAFVEAMRKAIQRGKVKVVEGVKKDTDARVVRSLRRPATYVPSMSALLNV